MALIKFGDNYIDPSQVAAIHRDQSADSSPDDYVLVLRSGYCAGISRSRADDLGNLSKTDAFPATFWGRLRKLLSKVFKD